MLKKQGRLIYLTFEKPLCYGTDEFSTTSLICRRCRAFKECKNILPKKPSDKKKIFKNVRPISEVEKDELGNL